jgi:hypothetical protein
MVARIEVSDNDTIKKITTTEDNHTIVVNESTVKICPAYEAFAFSDAPVDGVTYGRLNGAWEAVDANDFVPYTGATADVDLGEYYLTAENIYALSNLQGLNVYGTNGLFVTRAGTPQIEFTNLAGTDGTGVTIKGKINRADALGVYYQAGEIGMIRDGTWSGNDGRTYNSYLTFSNLVDRVVTEQIRVTDIGVGIGTTDPEYKLDVIGGARFTSEIGVGDVTGQYSALAPQFVAFTGNTDDLTAYIDFYNATTGKYVDLIFPMAADSEGLIISHVDENTPDMIINSTTGDISVFNEFSIRPDNGIPRDTQFNYKTKIQGHIGVNKDQADTWGFFDIYDTSLYVYTTAGEGEGEDGLLKEVGIADCQVNLHDYDTVNPSAYFSMNYYDLRITNNWVTQTCKFSTGYGNDDIQGNGYLYNFVTLEPEDNHRLFTFGDRYKGSVDHVAFDEWSNTIFKGNFTVTGNTDLACEFTIENPATFTEDVIIEKDLNVTGAVSGSTLSGDLTYTDLVGGTDTYIPHFGATGALQQDADLTYNDATNTLATTNLTLGGNLTVDTNTLFVDAANNKVGIGTITPATKLQVTETSAGAMTFPVTLNNGDGTDYTGVGIALSASATATAYKSAIGFERTTTWARGKMHFMVDGAADANNVTKADAKLTIDYSGNVGVGTTTPSEILEVVGNIKSSGKTTSSEFHLGTNATITFNSVDNSIDFTIL